jgi:membrane fusion protein, multidrug efflux system
MAKKAIYGVTLVAGIAAALTGAWWLQNKPAESSPGVAQASVGAGPKADAPGAGRPAGGAGGAGRAPGVEVAKVKTAPLQDDAQAVGTLKSRQSVMLRPEVAGRVSQIAFADGARVRKGQLLVQLDDVLQRAELSQAQAQVSIVRANLTRNQELLAEKFVAPRAVEESQAALQVAEAQLALAQARLGRMRIVAPFDGSVGIRNVNVGDYVKDGADLVNLEDSSALYVDFRVPERFQGKLATGQKVNVELDALPGQTFQAKVQALDPLVDANGRSVAVRAVLPGVGNSPLRPGMFARTTTVFSVSDSALVVPEEAIVPQGGKQFVFVLESQGEGDTKKQISRKVEVKLGVRNNAQVQLVSGVSAGDTVVVAGQQRLQKDGTEVRVVDMSGPPGGKKGPTGGGKPAGAGGAVPSVAGVPAKS